MDEMIDFVNEPIRISEEISFTLASVFIGLALFGVLVMVIRMLKTWLGQKLLVRIGISVGARAAVSNLVGYTLLFVGTLIILPVIFPGFNLNTLTLIIGGISVGIGFGLRNIADNFISGLIILVEGPVKVGDRVEIDGQEGDILEIRARSTVIKTNDNIDVIIPNSRFISQDVINLSLNDSKVRFRLPVGVHYDSDVALVEKALLEAAAECEDVLKDPQPGVRFISFDDSSLAFELRVWSDTLSHRPRLMRSKVNFKIWEKFKQHGIEIPYPQRDVHIRSGDGASKSESKSKSNMRVEGGRLRTARPIPSA